MNIQEEEIRILENLATVGNFSAGVDRLDNLIAIKETEFGIKVLNKLTRMEFENGEDDFTYYSIDEVSGNIADLEQQLLKLREGK